MTIIIVRVCVFFLIDNEVGYRVIKHVTTDAERTTEAQRRQKNDETRVDYAVKIRCFG